MSLIDLEIFVIMISVNFNKYEDGILFIKRCFLFRYLEFR